MDIILFFHFISMQTENKSVPYALVLPSDFRLSSVMTDEKINSFAPTCSICLDFVLIPHCLPCGHVFCKRCIETWMKQKEICPVDRKPFCASRLVPSYVTLREMGSLFIYCPQYEMKCTWKGRYRDLVQHILHCKTAQFKCPNKCGYQSKLADVKKHYNVCPLRIIFCTLNCGKSFPSKCRIWHEISECPKNNAICSECNERVLLCRIPDHLILSCHRSLQPLHRYIMHTKIHFPGEIPSANKRQKVRRSPRLKSNRLSNQDSQSNEEKKQNGVDEHSTNYFLSHPTVSSITRQGSNIRLSEMFIPFLFPQYCSFFHSISHSQLYPGFLFDVRDCWGCYFAGEIRETKQDMVKVHFVKWSSKHDEWIQKEDINLRIKPLGLVTQCELKHPFSVGQTVMVKGVDRLRMYRNPIWHFGKLIDLSGVQARVAYYMNGTTYTHWFQIFSPHNIEIIPEISTIHKYIAHKENPSPASSSVGKKRKVRS